MAARPTFLTVSSDFGSVYSAQVRAVLQRRVPRVRVLELSHDLPAHGIAEAAFLLRFTLAGFPPGGIHLAVVDPGVGGRRAPVVIELIDGSDLVGPNNGLLTPFAETVGVRSVHRIDPDRLPGGRRGSPTFDGRDLFAPAAAALAQGRRPGAFGPKVALARSPLSPPVRRVGGADGRIVHIDRFGDAITDVPGSWLPKGARSVRCSIRRRRVRRVPIVRVYEELDSGSPGLLISSFGTLELSVREGRGDRLLPARVGDPIRLRWSRPEPEPRHRR